MVSGKEDDQLRCATHGDPTRAVTQDCVERVNFKALGFSAAHLADYYEESSYCARHSHLYGTLLRS
jgi:hypothetical protein